LLCVGDDLQYFKGNCLWSNSLPHIRTKLLYSVERSDTVFNSKLIFVYVCVESGIRFKNAIDNMDEFSGYCADDSLYNADTYADELPYWNFQFDQPQLMVPYTLFDTPRGFNSGDQFFIYMKDSFDMLLAEGEYCPNMMSVGLHCRLAMTSSEDKMSNVARKAAYTEGSDGQSEAASIQSTTRTS